MDRVKLLAAIAITTMVIGVIGLMSWLIEKTDGPILLVIILVGIVGVVYCSL